jgi:protein TonB
MDRRDRSLAIALAASVVLHVVLLMLPAPQPRPPEAPPPVTVLATRMEPPPKPATPKPPSPPAPPEVLKNTFDPPQAQPLEDPIKPQPRRRVADKAVKAPDRTPPPKPAPPPPKVEAPRPPEPDPPLGQGLDLRPPRTPSAERLTPEALRETLTRLSEELLYPADALQRGLEGEVVILVELGADGRILDASIATGSGHRSLDDAAVRAVKKLGSLGPSSANKTILLPVRFRIL